MVGRGLRLAAAALALLALTAHAAPPTVTAQFVPSTVAVGNGYTVVWAATDTTSVTYSCTGAAAGSGALSPAPSGISFGTATSSMVGVTTCTVTATGPDGSASSAPMVLTVTASPTGGTCRIVGSTCVDGPATRTINGLAVYRSCWMYAQQFECVEPDSVDYCAPIANTPGCFQLASQCVSRAFDGTCLRYENDWRCGDPINPDPPNVTRLPDTYTVTRDVIDDSACRLLAGTSGCAQTQPRTCIEGPETRVINGLAIYKDCWKWSETYVCSDTAGTVSDCGGLESNPKCTLQSEACIDTNSITGACSFVTRVYKCEDQPAVSTEVTACGQTTCIAGVCDSGDDAADRDFANAVTAMEIAREIATYGDINANSFFRGADNRCSRKLFGIVSCCGGKVSAGTSNSAFSVSMTFGAQAGREAIRFLGSSYMHDVLFQQDWISSSLINAVYGTSGGASYASSFNFYGVSWNSVTGFAFDPTSFAVAVALQVLSQYLQCSTEEQVLSLKKGQNLCHYVGTYCAQKTLLGGCLTKKDTQCCFNSRLARIVHEQGRPQIGRGWGSAQAPDCGGFTIEQLEQLDFSRMDLSEFVREVSARAIDTGAATARAQDRANAILNAPPGSYFPPPGASGTCAPPNC